VLDDSWIVRWVRGPRTATALGLPHSLGLGDPAILLPHALKLAAQRDGGVGFMPHFESVARGAWQQVAALAGVTLIDPRRPPLEILADIGRCSLLLSEALHGVIVADALRVPWIAVRPLARIHRAKWQDWAETVQVAPRLATLPASSLAEWAGASGPTAAPMNCAWLGRVEHRLAAITAERLVARATLALARATRMAPQLSPDRALDRCQSRMLDAVAALQRQPCHLFRVDGRSHLQVAEDSAYQLELTG
jgi:succinoglycan biosynthesis protein ExoV